MSVKNVCRDIDELSKVARTAILLLFQECYKEGVAVFVTETYRSQARQDYLYEQGRTRTGPVVTWTQSSRHKSRLAWDIGAAQVDGNTDIYKLSVIKKAGAIAKKLGITWGGTWTKNLDYPHFEVTENWKIPKGYALEGAVSVPAVSTGRIKLVESVSKLPKVQTSIPETQIEEALKVNQIPLLKDMSSTTLRTSIVNMVKDAHAAGIIKDVKWVKEAEAGTLSIADVVGLQIHIDSKKK